MGNITEKEKRLLVVLAVLAAVMYGAVWGGEKYTGEYQAQESRTNNELRGEVEEYRKRLSEIQDEERLQNQYVESYLAYQNSGLIVDAELGGDTAEAAVADEERRLVLLERIKQIQNDRKLFPVNLRLTQPSNLPSSFSTYTEESNVSVRTNTMTISMNMLHSMDMLMLLGDFHDPASNAFTPVRCSLKRLFEPTADQDIATQLLEANENIWAQCDLVWLTVFDPLQGKATGASTEAS